MARRDRAGRPLAAGRRAAAAAAGILRFYTDDAPGLNVRRAASLGLRQDRRRRRRR